MNNTGQGLMGIHGPDDLPDDCVAFIADQYRRFNIPVPPDEIIRVGAWATYYVIDYVDPYALLCGASDVEVTDEWAFHTYELLDEKKPYEAEPEHTETFTFRPGQDELVFNDLIARPGLSALPHGIGDTIDEVIWGDVHSSGSPVDELCSESDDWLDRQVLDAPEEQKGSRKLAFFQLSAWAAFLWFIGPYGREFRWKYHEVFALAMTHGSAFLYKGYFVSPEHVRKLPRPPQSCAVCGLDSWCVDLVHISGTTRFMCEKHLNGDMPLYGQANCGSRVCRFVQCAFHPLHGQQDAMHRMLSTKGQLIALAQQKRAELEQKTAPKLLAN